MHKYSREIRTLLPKKAAHTKGVNSKCKYNILNLDGTYPRYQIEKNFFSL